MAYINSVLLWFIMAYMALAQMMPIDPGCATSSPPVKTLTFTQWMAPQIAPTSTIYQMVVTHYDYIVFCSNGAATVTNVPANPAPSGPFTTAVTSSVLVVEAVQCIPSDMVLTRRETGAYDHVKQSTSNKNVVATTLSFPEQPGPTQSQAISYLAGIYFPIVKGWKHSHAVNQPKAIRQAKSKRQDVPTTLSPEGAALVSQLQTAEYALELCNSDFNLSEICTELRDPAAITPLANVGVSASQASDIVCFASVYGIDLNTTNAALLGDLAAAVYGLELDDNFTNTTNTTRLCNSIDLAAAPYLGINADAVNNYICGSPSASVTITAVTTQTVVVNPGALTITYTPSGAPVNSANPAPTFTASGVVVSGGMPLQSGMNSGAPNQFPNGTFPQATGGSAVSAGTLSTGMGSPSGNSTGIDGLGNSQSFPPLQGGSQKTPVARDEPHYYPATTMETFTSTYGRYN